MLSTRILGLASAVTVFVCLTAATVFAQPVDKRTTFTFSEPVALPGVTLPAGRYLFRLADPVSASKVVQVLDADIPAVSATPAAGSTTSPATPMQADMAKRTQLPQTASQLPLLAMIATMTLMSAAVLRQSRRRKR